MSSAPAADSVRVEVLGVRFRSDDGEFAVADAMTLDDEKHLVLVGAIAHLDDGDRIEAFGAVQEHHKHGARFKVERVISMAPTTEEAISRVLQKVPGVGPAAADQLIKRFGDELFQRLNEDPADVLRRVRGLSGEKLRKAAEHWRTEADQMELRLLLENHSVDAATIGRVVKALGEELSLEAVKTNPYKLTERSGIGFVTADQIALALGEARDGDHRIKAALIHALDQASDDGHCYLPLLELTERTSRLLGIDEYSPGNPIADIHRCIDELVFDGALVKRGDLLATFRLEVMEEQLADVIGKLASSPPVLGLSVSDAPPPELNPAPSDQQWLAVRQACEHRISVLTGGPGTGKTETMRSLVSQIRSANKQVVLCAPTGKAARRLTEATGAQATTIHRLLGYLPGEGFAHDEDDPIAEDSMLVVDEASMLSLELALALMRSVGPTTHVLLVGDIDQLAPVGPGRVLQDVIESGVVPSVCLSEIFRQAQRSLIIRAAHSINRGEQPQTEAAEGDLRDFFLIERFDSQSVADEIVTLATTRLPAHYDVSAKGGVQVLCPQRRGVCGVQTLNERLRDELNPPLTDLVARPKGEIASRPALGPKQIREGDRVMQTRNDYEIEVMNGELGVLQQVEADGNHAWVVMDDGRRIRVPIANIDSWDLAYACTVHKAQGSSVPVVVVPVVREHSRMLTRNLLYTAVTRAERACVLVGDRQAIAGALRRVDGATRFTALAERLRDLQAT